MAGLGHTLTLSVNIEVYSVWTPYYTWRNVAQWFKQLATEQSVNHLEFLLIFDIPVD